MFIKVFGALILAVALHPFSLAGDALRAIPVSHSVLKQPEEFYFDIDAVEPVVRYRVTHPLGDYPSA